jgi:hypothetical protein
MSDSLLFFLNPIVLGIGATLTLDLWTLFLQHAFKITSPSYCLVGRWLLYMPQGIFRHSPIGSTPQKNGECTVGWIAHYLTGIIFAVGFIAFAGRDWLQHPTLIPALVFGIATVLAPFVIMQPSLGLGIAASKTSNPWQARLRSLMNHTLFGIGLYLCGLLTHWLL